MVRRYFISGVWDLFHVGHLNALKAIKRYDYEGKLVVGVITDELAEQYKGRRPIINYDQRKQIVESLFFVDDVIETHKLFDIDQMKTLSIDVYFVGCDWEHDERMYELKQEFPVVYLPRTEGISTSYIKKRIIDETTTQV